MGTTTKPAHRSASGARKKGECRGIEAGEESKPCQCIGRSKGGLTTKIHALCDADGKSTALLWTAGQASDLCGFEGLSDFIFADVLIADKGYDAEEWVRQVLSTAGKMAVIPPRCNRKHPAEDDKGLYQERHKIENFFGRLEDYRGIATRDDKTAGNFLSGVCLAAAMLWIN